MPVKMAKNEERAAADAERLATQRRKVQSRAVSLAPDPAVACAPASATGAAAGEHLAETA